MKRALVVVVILLVIAVGAVFGYLRTTGLKARGAAAAPLEARAARWARAVAIPPQERAHTSPFPSSPETIQSGLEHYANHCAVCHANDGSGDTDMGRNMWPKAPDMRLATTQQMTDGELFWVIENGVRFTGMPGWGTDDPDPKYAALGWQLVHFVRQLPNLTPEQLAQMEALNPRPPAEVRQQIEEERFLSHQDDAPVGR